MQHTFTSSYKGFVLLPRVSVSQMTSIDPVSTLCNTMGQIVKFIRSADGACCHRDTTPSGSFKYRVRVHRLNSRGSECRRAESKPRRHTRSWCVCGTWSGPRLATRTWRVWLRCNWKSVWREPVGEATMLTHVILVSHSTPVCSYHSRFLCLELLVLIQFSFPWVSLPVKGPFWYISFF